MGATAIALLAAAVALAVGVAIGRSRRLDGSLRRSGAPVEAASGVTSADGYATSAGAAATAAADDDGRPLDDVGPSLREAVNHLDLGVVVASPAGAVVYRNAAARRYDGTHVGVLLDGHVEEVLQRARDGERVDRTVELHGPPKISLALVAESMPDGAAVATVQDVSERVRIDAMRTDFVSNISHELKTPVGALAVLAETLADASDPQIVARVADRMVGEAHRAVRAIDDLLELSRIESTHRTDEVVDLVGVVQASVSRGCVLDGPAGVRVVASPVEPDVRLRADGRQLVSAVGNLVENAVKYSYAGGVVTVRADVGEGGVDIVVADRGIGIPARDLDRVFERFYRVDKARSRSTGGTGLGLAIVRHVATNHGGEVLVSSTEGQGSTFTLRLPASVVVPADTAPDAAPDPVTDRNGAGTMGAGMNRAGTKEESAP